QRSVENRDDVLVYSIGPLEHDLDVTGPVSATLFVKSSAVDTDFTGKLVDVAPDGFATDVAEGILRMRYRDSREHASLMNPGQTYEITLDLWSTSNVFLRGHTLRLEFPAAIFLDLIGISTPARKSEWRAGSSRPRARFSMTRSTLPRWFYL
ncbi:MAG TPA: CocE/NonD family hydrolase, partial [Candidatus Sulfotelmatobacter sp.]|nr:CocE/NonD family hydrolase [Candidatus Sulfotelmatobacter sp.]